LDQPRSSRDSSSLPWNGVTGEGERGGALEPSLPLPGEAPPDDAVLSRFTDWVAAQGPTLPHHRGCPLSATAT